MKHLNVTMIFSLLVGTAIAVPTIQSVQAKNESQINAVSTSFGSLKSSNTTNISSISMESAQKSAKIKINNMKISSSNMPNIDVNTIKPNKIDINQLLEQTQKTVSLNTNNTDISLYLSFTSMPIDEITLYSGQAVKYNIPVVIRGFINNSYKDTSKYLRTLRDLYPELTVMIDPPAYEKYDIRNVPTLVVTKTPDNPLKDGCNSAGDFSKVTGEVSIQAMLDYVRQYSKNPILVAAATQRLNDVREKRYFQVQ